MALKTLSVGQPLVCAVYSVTSQLQLGALIPVCLSSQAAFLFFFFFFLPPPAFLFSFLFIYSCVLGDVPWCLCYVLGGLVLPFKMLGGRKAAATRGIETRDPINCPSITLPLLSMLPCPPHPTLSPTKASCWQQQR